MAALVPSFAEWLQLVEDHPLILHPLGPHPPILCLLKCVCCPKKLLLACLAFFNLTSFTSFFIQQITQQTFTQLGRAPYWALASRGG